MNTTVYDGKTELVSCGQGTNNCCLRGEQCGTNLLCKSIDGPNGGWLKRQYCADIYWEGCSKAAPGKLLYMQIKQYRPNDLRWSTEYQDGGVVLNNCLNNVFTLQYRNCSGEGAGPFFFVDPTNGDVTSMSTSSGTTATASYWSINTAEALASQSAASVSASLAALSTSSSAQSTPTATASTRASAASASPTASQTPSPSGGSGLSAGAGAGIGIGAAAAIALIAGLGWFWRRERKKRLALQGQSQAAYAPQTSELAYSPHPNTDTHKIVYAQHQEPVQYAPQELDHGRPRNEVP